MLPSYLLSIETPTPLVLGVGVMFAPVTGFVTFVRFGRRLSGNLCVEEYLHCVSRLLALQALFLLRRLPPLAETSSGVSLPGSSSSSSSLPLGGQGRQEGSQGAPVFCLGRLPPLPLDLGRVGGVAVPLDFCLGRAGVLPLLLLLRERARWGLPARCRLSVFRASDFVVSPQFSPHVPRRENSRETS